MIDPIEDLGFHPDRLQEQLMLARENVAYHDLRIEQAVDDLHMAIGNFAAARVKLTKIELYLKHTLSEGQ